MNDKGTETRFKLTPLDKSGLAYLGIDITNGKSAALFILLDNQTGDSIVPEADLIFRATIISLISHGFLWFGETYEQTEIEGLRYRVIPWTQELDQSLVNLIDRLVHTRMTNATAVSLELQLEMPI